MRRHVLATVLAFLAPLLVATSGAQAVVVNDQGTHAGVALVPGTSLPDDLSANRPSGLCTDHWLSPDLGGPLRPLNGGLCWNGGGTTPSKAVMHANETFAITWDPGCSGADPCQSPRRSYSATTRNYVERFLRDVADGSGTLTSPYAVTTQYRDEAGRAANASKYGGACIDYGNPGGSACRFGNTIGTGPGKNYPSSGCPTTGSSDYCLTDSQLQTELRTMIQNMGLVRTRIQPGYTPLLVLLTPQSVEVCVDAGGNLCSANAASTGDGTSTARFCSYHSHIWVGNEHYAYAVQPWTAGTGCDEPGLPAGDPGSRLVNPLSQGQIAAIVNPWLNGWFGVDGSEIGDNGCMTSAPQAKVGNGKYSLQPEFNNAGLIEIDPIAPECATHVAFSPRFVVPSPINAAKVVAFDGSTTVSTLIVPNADYHWNFGDGTIDKGASVVHSYARGGTYIVTLTVIDRGGNYGASAKRITVLGADGSGVQAELQLTLQSLRSVLRSGVSLRVTSNERADGIMTVSMTRSAAMAAHIKTGRGSTVAIGRGTTKAIKAGTVRLRLRLSRTMVAKLEHLRHVKLTIRVALVAANGDRGAWVAAGAY